MSKTKAREKKIKKKNIEMVLLKMKIRLIIIY